MSQSGTLATRNEATRHLKPPKVTPFAKLAIGTAIWASHGRLHNVWRTQPQPPDPQSETGTFATHSRKKREKTEPFGVAHSAESSPLSAARTLLDLARCSCYAGLQLAVTKRDGTAARRKALVMLPFSCYVGLQLEVAKSTALAARGRELDCRSYRRGSRKQFKADVAQIRSCSEKQQLREEVPQRRGRTVKK